VRIEAPFDLRLARVQEREGLDPQAAEDRVEQQDRAAAEFIKTSYGVDWADPLLYHLVLNTGKWSVDDAAQIIVEAARRVAGQAGPQGTA
jgi:cytidylate kinase